MGSDCKKSLNISKLALNPTTGCTLVFNLVPPRTLHISAMHAWQQYFYANINTIYLRKKIKYPIMLYGGCYLPLISQLFNPIIIGEKVNTLQLPIFTMIPLRYLAARNFMLSGTALLRGMTYSCCEELGTFKPSFHPQHWYFEAKN